MKWKALKLIWELLKYLDRKKLLLYLQFEHINQEPSELGGAEPGIIKLSTEGVTARCPRVLTTHNKLHMTVKIRLTIKYLIQSVVD